jgi:hypothetical protein
MEGCKHSEQHLYVSGKLNTEGREVGSEGSGGS